MDFFTALLRAYEAAEDTGWVDNAQKSTSPLLPIYHTSRRSNGKDTIAVLLDNEGNFMKADFMADGESIIFPVTSDSVARSGKNPAPHPLVDKLTYYLSEIDQGQYDTYHRQLDEWISQCQEPEVKRFLSHIQHFLLQDDFIDNIVQSLYGRVTGREGLKVTFLNSDDSEKTIDLSTAFLEFKVDQFIGYQTVSVTNYLDLHKAYISYVESNQKADIICNISGKQEVLAAKHRGLIGNAKLISVSNNIETYKGRFKEREDVFTVGNQTSEKIHLMAKFLLENEHTHAWLGSGQHLINWFSDDLTNETQLDITTPKVEDNGMFDFGETTSDDSPKFQVTEANKKIRSAFIHGKKEFGDGATYYIAIVNKTNDGRVALKYFRQLAVSQLLDNLNKWQDKYSWPFKKKNGEYAECPPSYIDIILAAYGVDRGRFLELDNDKFKSDQFQKLATSMIDGKDVPETILGKLRDNIKQRQRYGNTWKKVLFVSLALLHKNNKEEFTPMLDHENKNRSYLFGRLLAIFELLELQRYQLDGSKNDRITNAERYWTAYTSQPAKLMMNLTNKIRPYEEAVKLNSPGIFKKLDKEREEIMALLSPLMQDRGINDPLDYRFIFGYYAEKQYFYTKQEKTESEE
ncbi:MULTISPECIES: type I-C CRISPR-associated protein Cas8c/Csd1 [Streptococcus]|uniref:Type I-C CRISPR-associated protein Cas8c/Csd1 n=2 Tax=Streptococcus suis TaxID=1307 RepID=A0A4T2HC20_STRSU|nr:type I-C CRISPR-associated protein Cas8c/Csd1 [Streptococcus suis]MBM7318883.1 type I-C CRISPR-associated protein Cas8c/Csd1 [Streptococcus suis]MBY4634712.1 type I-C CRISPR-associated protein Cas8c/Csd1 [Streptococcus suis]MBY4964474.1 type I-C CRISPR-associated protein Cas8c/Csd1 [Streptococcus suis]TII04687.1 type I-C CRISPR-associated protein Cas8c/Csd1 [Streptococcus suis]TII09682.1 type I-C CRISPR-associated protein Cas8c/Csd1 [Streptococcus suis]